ncbi:MAG: SPFH domain-containing protein [Lachnospiraceae bacterium]|nr:SPFH domain-containing protein [Lachnospiraceae bacterium]
MNAFDGANAVGDIKSGIFDVVKFDGLRGRDWIVYKYPAEGIVWGSQVVVQEGQVALFVKGGEIYDVMEAGTYTLETKNLPILCKVVNAPFGKKTPFSAEIYFINIATKLDVYWGTSDPISIVDPKYFVRLRIRAFGQMGLKLVDSKLFFKELIGGMSRADYVKYDKVRDFYRGLVVLKTKSVIAETIINEKISALEISARLEDISDKSKEKLLSEFEKYGLRVVNFYVESVNFPDEDFEKINSILENKAEFEIMGDGRYVTKRSFDVYESAAKNESGVAGALAAGGVGMGVGMGMVSNLNNPNMNPAYDSKSRICPKCGAKNSMNSKFCNECGEQMIEEGISCPHCGNMVKKGAKFCDECGFSFAKHKCKCGADIEYGKKFCSECGEPVE